jgi:N-acetylneuraminic acid mutarotase
MKFSFYAFILSFVFFADALHAQVWEQLNDFPGIERDDAVSFVINNEAYCGTGITIGWSVLNDFHRLNLSNHTWSSIASMPVNASRQYACGFSHQQKGYVFGGYKDGIFLNSLFQYDSQTNEWTELNSLPSVGRGGSSCFVIADKAYIIGGKNNSEAAMNEVWAFDLISQSWEQKNDFPFGNRWRASAVSNNDKGYYGFGRDENSLFHSDFYQYSPNTDAWISLASIPNPARNYAQMVVFQNEVVILFGVDSNGVYLNDVLKYTESTNTWNMLPSFTTTARKGGLAFSNAHSIYYTTGITLTNDRLKETWRLVLNDLSVQSESEIVQKVYPNPTADYLNIPDCKGTLRLLNFKGEMIREFPENNKILDLSALPNGIYLLICGDGWSEKVFINS